jgi:hypothetical protein
MSIIRPKFLVHVTTLEPEPVPMPRELTYDIPSAQRLHLLNKGDERTRCGRPRDVVERAWKFDVWSRTLELHADHYGACWFNADHIMAATMRMRG